MEDNKKNPTPTPPPDPETQERAVKPKRRWKYVGQPFKTGIYLPDLVTKINPDTATDTEIDAYVKRFPKLRGGTFQEL